MGTLWPTLGRASHIDAVNAALLAGSGTNGVVLTGGAGVGKTTLAKEAVRASGDNFRWVVGTESARTVPLGAFSHLIQVSSPIEPATVLRAARAELETPGMVIGVDDAHLLDNFSATLVHQLAMSGSVRLVVTIRDGEQVPDAITALWKDEWLARLELDSFTREQTVELAESVLGGPLEGSSLDRIFQVSEGNPLFLRHLIEGAVAAGTLRESGGVWQLRGKAAITPRLYTLVESAVTRLSPDERRVLEVLSLCEPLDLEVLADLTSVDLVESAERSGLVRLTPGQSDLVARLGHPLYSEVLRQRMDVKDARALRGKLVARMSGVRSGDILDQIRIATLALDSDTPPQPEMLIDAARDSLRLGAMDLCERLALGAKNAGGGFYASVYLGHALAWQGRGPEVENELGQYDPENLNEIEMLQWGLPRAANLFWALGRPADARKCLDLMYGRATERMVRDLIESLDATFLMYENKPSESVAMMQRVMASPACPPMARAWAGSSGSVSLAMLGRFDEVEPLATPALEAAHQSEVGNVRLTCGLGQTFALIMTGDLDEAEALSRHYIDFAEMQQPGRSLAGVLLGRVLFTRGELGKAYSEFQQAAAALDGTGFSWAMLSVTHLAQTASALGLADDAHDALLRAERLYGDNVESFLPELLLARAWVAACDGEHERARTMAREAASAALTGGQVAVAARMLTMAAEFGDRTVAAELEALTAKVPGRFAAAGALLARGLADDNGATLDAAAAEFEQIGMLLAAADCAAHASRAHNAAGRRAEEIGSAATAQRLAAQCGNVRTPALTGSAKSLPLTTREREVAQMVAGGLSNREIAEQLVVSIRTVEGHIYRSCTKLDVPDRAALGALVSAAIE